MTFKKGIPVKQLEIRHYRPWEGVNVQEEATVPPQRYEDTLALYLVDVGTEGSKRFTVTASLTKLLNRETKMVAYGSTWEDGK